MKIVTGPAANSSAMDAFARGKVIFEPHVSKDELSGSTLGRVTSSRSQSAAEPNRVDQQDPLFSLYTKREYFTQLTKEVHSTKKGDRVLVEAMGFDPDEQPIKALVEALLAAAKRGVSVTLNFDAIVFMLLGKVRPGPLWYHDDFPRRLDRASAQRLEIIKKLRAVGVVVGITNQPHQAHSKPVAGRSHIKAAIVNDKVYIGGCNLNDPDEIDLMTAWHDRSTADWLHTLLQEVGKTQQTSAVFHGVDQQYQVDDRSTIFIDAGAPKQSIILEQALALIDSAKDWLFVTCQYFPHSATAQHLAAAARRGVKVELAFNRPSKHGILAPAHQAVIWREHFRQLPKSFFAGQLPRSSNYIHAKLIACDQGALLGSHNYVSQGVNFGTAEIALLRHDASYARRAYEKLTIQI